MDAEVSSSRLVYEAIPRTGATFRELVAATGKGREYVEAALKTLRTARLIELRMVFKTNSWFKCEGAKQDDPADLKPTANIAGRGRKRATRVVDGIDQTWCPSCQNFVANTEFYTRKTIGRSPLADQCKECSRKREKDRAARRRAARLGTTRYCTGQGGHMAPLNRFSLAATGSGQYAKKCRDCLRTERV